MFVPAYCYLATFGFVQLAHQLLLPAAICVVQLETRVYGLDPGDSMQFVPLMDFADHSNDSPNYYDDGPCSNSSGGSLAADLDSPKQCFVAYAGAPIQAWEEVTMQYRWDRCIPIWEIGTGGHAMCVGSLQPLGQMGH